MIKLASYLSRVLCKSRFILFRINGLNDIDEINKIQGAQTTYLNYINKQFIWFILTRPQSSLSLIETVQAGLK